MKAKDLPKSKVNHTILTLHVTIGIPTVQIITIKFQAWIVERMGKFYRILDPGLNLLWPIIDRVKYVQSLKEIAIDVPKQSAITSDNVTLDIDGVLYLRIVDPYLGKLLHYFIIHQQNM